MSLSPDATETTQILKYNNNIYNIYNNNNNLTLILGGKIYSNVLIPLSKSPSNGYATARYSAVAICFFDAR